MTWFNDLTLNITHSWKCNKAFCSDLIMYNMILIHWVNHSPTMVVLLDFSAEQERLTPITCSWATAVTCVCCVVLLYVKTLELVNIRWQHFRSSLLPQPPSSYTCSMCSSSHVGWPPSSPPPPLQAPCIEFCCSCLSARLPSLPHSHLLVPRSSATCSPELDPLYQPSPYPEAKRYLLLILLTQQCLLLVNEIHWLIDWMVICFQANTAFHFRDFFIIIETTGHLTRLLSVLLVFFLSN